MCVFFYYVLLIFNDKNTTMVSSSKKNNPSRKLPKNAKKMKKKIFELLHERLSEMKRLQDDFCTLWLGLCNEADDALNKFKDSNPTVIEIWQRIQTADSVDFKSFRYYSTQKRAEAFLDNFSKHHPSFRKVYSEVPCGFYLVSGNRKTAIGARQIASENIDIEKFASVDLPPRKNYDFVGQQLVELFTGRNSMVDIFRRLFQMRSTQPYMEDAGEVQLDVFPPSLFK